MVQVIVETGQRRAFASAVEWPGWCRGGRDAEAAVTALAEYGARYAPVAAAAGIRFEAPTNAAGLQIVEEAEGDATTDFGAPGIVMDADHEPVDDDQSRRLLALLRASWAAFDDVAARHHGAELQKGPRGGGREVEGIVDHVLGADAGYLSMLGGRWKRDEDAPLDQEWARLRDTVAEVWALRLAGETPPRVPRPTSKPLWPLRYFARRSAWHALDHAWEIEDRLLS